MRKIIAALVAATALTACSGSVTPLAPGLTARMDQPGARLDRASAFGIMNHFRATRNAPALTDDAALDEKAQALAEQYAAASSPPAKPEGVADMRLSSGYPTFADTFSGWRNGESDAGTLTNPAHTRAGLGVAYSPNSAYGVYWVLLLDGGMQTASAR